MQSKTIDELLAIMNTGFIRSEIKAATAEYWRRVDSGEHTRPAPTEIIGEQESPAAFTARKLSELEKLAR